MTVMSMIQEMNEAIVDLQASDYDTYDRPLQRLASVFASAKLKPIIDELKTSVDFDSFLEDANKGGSFAGRSGFNWPSDRYEEFGLILTLIERGANDPRWFMNFAVTFYHGGTKLVASIQKVTHSVIVPFGRNFARYLEHRASTRSLPKNEEVDSDRVFIVHGHDEASRESVARFIENLGLTPVILHEQASRGMTVPEKLEEYGNVGYAVILLTPDDVGREKGQLGDQPRARQNVILELGYFVGRLGRGRVIAFRKDDVEIPSDYLGVVYTDFDARGAWRQELTRELRSAGYEIDLSRAIG